MLQSPVMGSKHGFQLPAVESTEPVPRGIFSQREIQLPKSGDTTLTGTVPNRFIKQLIRKQYIRSEIGSACSIVNFKSFKDIFSGSNHARGFDAASKIFSAQLATNYTRSCPLRHGSGLQARVDIAPDSKQNQGPSSFFTHRMQKNRHRNYRSLGQRGIEQARAGFRPVSKQYFLGSQAGREIMTGDQPKRFEHSHPIRSFQKERHPPSAPSASASRLAGEH